jgi:hypothetical protein
MDAKTIYVYQCNRYNDYTGIIPGADKELDRVPGCNLAILCDKGFTVVKCDSREEALSRSRADNKTVDSPLYPKEIFNNSNVRERNNLNNNVKNGASFNNNVRGYLSSLPRYPDGRRKYGSWAAERPAYQLKFKCFTVLKMAEDAGQPPLDSTFLALNAGCRYETILSALVKWVKSGHVSQFPFTPAPGMNKTYRLGKRGKHMLDKIESKQPEWAAARHSELNEWLDLMGPRLEELGANNKSAHIILKESALEDWHQPKRKPSPAKVKAKLCPRCGRALKPYQGGMACFNCNVLFARQ